eukprot:TRINITY_DN13323_c0_g2_i1.p1 TRINITY_DN13323_c0_g2~~TRINITY_DN13323_c0_g2_i1.p1  ORF type:complete len:320 (-),score=56.46 TRINITY_DN13323_c0_g2_i1:218-1177(-)
MYATRSPEWIAKSMLAFAYRLKEGFNADPIFVFDSPHKEEIKVKHTLEKRRLERDATQAKSREACKALHRLLDQFYDVTQPVSKRQKCKRCNRRSQMQICGHYERKGIKVSEEIVNLVKLRLTESGFQVRIARLGDAEEEAAKSASENNDLVASEDLDALIHGAPTVIRFLDRFKPAAEQYQFKLAADIKLPVLIRLDELMKGLGFAKRRQLVDFAILCGCDFATRLKKIGPVAAHRIILKHGAIGYFTRSVEGRALEWENFDYQAARKMFERKLGKSKRLKSFEKKDGTAKLKPKPKRAKAYEMRAHTTTATFDQEFA